MIGQGTAAFESVLHSARPAVEDRSSSMPTGRYMGSPLSVAPARGTLEISVSGSRVILFFFQAEDGIRDYKVTGVQTCALPIFQWKMPETRSVANTQHVHRSVG